MRLSATECHRVPPIACLITECDPQQVGRLLSCVRHLDDFGHASRRLLKQAVEACGQPTAALALEYTALLRRARAAEASEAALETWTGSRVVDAIMLEGLAGGFKTLMDETDGLGTSEEEVSSLARRAAVADETDETDETGAARRKLLLEVALPLRTLVHLHREIQNSPQDETRAEMGAERTHPAQSSPPHGSTAGLGFVNGRPPHGSTTGLASAAAPPPTSFTPTSFTPPRVSANDSAIDCATDPAAAAASAAATAPVLLRGASRRWLAPGDKSAKALNTALNLELLQSLNTTLRLDEETMLNTTLAELRHVGERWDASLVGKSPSEATSHLGPAASSTAATDCRAGPSASGDGGGGAVGQGDGVHGAVGQGDGVHGAVGQGDGVHSDQAAASPSLLTLLFRQGVCMRLSIPNLAASLLHRRVVPAQPSSTATVHTSSSAAALRGRPPQRFDEWTELARAGVGGLTVALSTAGIEAVPSMEVLGDASFRAGCAPAAPTISPPRSSSSKGTRRHARAVSGAMPAAEHVREVSLGLVWNRRTSWSVRLCSLAVFDGTVQLPSLGGGVRSSLAGGDVALPPGSEPRRAAAGTEASSIHSYSQLDALFPRALSSVPQLGAQASAVEVLARPESVHISQREIVDETRAGGLARNAAAVGKLLRSLFTGGKGHGPVKSGHADERSRRSPAGEVGDCIELEAEAEAAGHFGEAFVPSGDLSSQVLVLAATLVRPEVKSPHEVTSPEPTHLRFVGRISALEIVYKRELVLAVVQWLDCLKELQFAGTATNSAGAATKSAGAATTAPGSATEAAANGVHGSKYGPTAGSKFGPTAAASSGGVNANGSATAAAAAISTPRWSISLDLKAEMPMLIFPLLPLPPGHAPSPRARYDAPTSGEPAGYSAVSSATARNSSVRRRPTSSTGVSSTSAEPLPNTAPTPLRALVLDLGRIACYHAPPAGFVRTGSSGDAQYGAASSPTGVGRAPSRAPSTTAAGSGGEPRACGAAAEGTAVDEARVAGAPGGGAEGRWDLEGIWAHLHAEVLSLPPTKHERAAPLSLLQGSVALGMEIVHAAVGAHDGAVTDGAGARYGATSAPTGLLGTALGLRVGALALDLSTLEIVISSELSTAVISAHSQLTRAGRTAASVVSAARASVQPPLGTAPPHSAVLGATSASSSAHLSTSVVTQNDSRHHVITVNDSLYKSELPYLEADPPQISGARAREIESRAPRCERPGLGRPPLLKPLAAVEAAAHAGGAHEGAFTDRGVEPHGGMIERLVTVAADRR